MRDHETNHMPDCPKGSTHPRPFCPQQWDLFSLTAITLLRAAASFPQRIPLTSHLSPVHATARSNVTGKDSAPAPILSWRPQPHCHTNMMMCNRGTSQRDRGPLFTRGGLATTAFSLWGRIPAYHPACLNLQTLCNTSGQSDRNEWQATLQRSADGQQGRVSLPDQPMRLLR